MISNRSGSGHFSDKTASFLIVLSAILAPLRLDDSEVLRPVTLIGLPAIIFISFSRNKSIFRIIGYQNATAPLLLFFFILIGYFLDNDVLPSGYRDLSYESVITAPIFYFISIYVAKNARSDKQPIGLALALGILIHTTGSILLPAQVEYKEFSRATGFLLDPNIMLLHLLPPVLLLPAFCFNERKLRVVFVALLLSVVWATLLSMSRAGLAFFLLMSISLAIYGLIGLAKFCSPWKRVTILYLSLVTITIYLFARMNNERISRLFEITKFRIDERVEESGLIGDRLDLYGMIFDKDILSLISPIGIGYRAALQGSTTLPHNTFIDALIVGGSIAFISISFIYFKYTYISIIKTYSQFNKTCPHHYYLWISLSLISQIFLISSLSVFAWKINWVCLGLAIGSIQRPLESVR